MTGVYAYCLTTPTETEGVELAGFGTGSVFLHPIGEPTLWLSRVETAPGASLDAVRTHDAVVAAAWTRARACVPFRFGQWFASVEAAAEAIEERRTSLEEALGRLDGAAELDLKVLRAGEPSPAGNARRDARGDSRENDRRDIRSEEARASGMTGPGRAYLESLRERKRERSRRDEVGEALAKEVRRAVAGIAREDRVLPLRGSRGVLEMAHLVPRGREEEWRRAVDGVRNAHRDLAFLVTGPWPPYSFGP